MNRKNARTAAILVAGWLALAAPLWLMAAWDSSKPTEGPNSPLVSAHIRSNFQAVEKSMLSKNLLEDATFQLWTGGTSAPPYGWTLTGAGAAAAQETGGANLNGLGPYSAKLTFGSATAYIERAIQTTTTFLSYFRGRSFSFTAYVKASSASQARIEIEDGIGSSFSGYHTGGGTFEQLSVTRTLDAAATRLNVRIRNELSGSIYAHGVSLTFGEIPGTVLVPRRSMFDAAEIFRVPTALTSDRLTPYGLIGILDTQFSVAGVACPLTTETDLFTYTLPADVLDKDGKAIRVTFGGFAAANANTKTLKAYFGGTSVTVLNATFNNVQVSGSFIVQRTGASAELMPVFPMNLPQTTGAVTTIAAATSSNQIVKITGTCPTAANDLKMHSWFVELLPRPIQ